MPPVFRMKIVLPVRERPKTGRLGIDFLGFDDKIDPDWTVLQDYRDVVRVGVSGNEKIVRQLHEASRVYFENAWPVSSAASAEYAN